MPPLNINTTEPVLATLTLTHTQAAKSNDLQTLAQLERAYLQYVGRALQARRAIDVLRSRLGLPPSYVTCVAVSLTGASIAPSQSLQSPPYQPFASSGVSAAEQANNVAGSCPQNSRIKTEPDPDAVRQVEISLDLGTNPSTSVFIQPSTTSSTDMTPPMISEAAPPRTRDHLKRKAKELRPLQSPSAKRRLRRQASADD